MKTVEIDGVSLTEEQTLECLRNKLNESYDIISETIDRLDEIDNTGTLVEKKLMAGSTKGDLEEFLMQAHEKLQEPEFTYPMWFKHISSSLVVRFDALRNATCIIAGDGWENREVSTTCKPHTDEKIWKQVDEPKQYERCREGYTVYGNGEVVTTRAPTYYDNFNIYPTTKLAEKAALLMHESNKLIYACLLEEHELFIEDASEYRLLLDFGCKCYADYKDTRDREERVAKRMSAWKDL